MQAWAALEGKQGDAAKAERLFKAAAKAEPGNPQLLNAWAGFEKRRGNAAGARQLLEQTLAANGQQAHVPSMQVTGLLLPLWALSEVLHCTTLVARVMCAVGYRKNSFPFHPCCW